MNSLWQPTKAWAYVLTLLLSLLGPLAARAAVVDISTTPLSTATTSSVRANLMFVLDDSGSMAFDYLPDSADTNDVCFGVVAKNGVFYDPTRTYLAPLKANGTAFTDASFTAASSDGYNGGSTTDLSNLSNLSTPNITVLGTTGPTVTGTTVSGPVVCGRKSSSACDTTPDSSSSSSSSTVAGLKTTTTTTVDRTYVRGNAPGKTCSSVSNSCTLTTTTTTSVSTQDSGRFYWATLKAGQTSNCAAPANYDIVYKTLTLTAAQKTNYANWYAYYRTRMLSMRAGAGRAFAGIDASRFRVGFSTISYTGITEGSDFLNIRDFDGGTQKADFYSKLYSNSPYGGTPLRPALVKAGKYYAGKISGQTNDPMQYSCQRNYTILSTDGYWNTGGGEPSYYVPKRLDNSTAIGNQDGGNSIARPLRDECTASSNKNSCTAALGPGVSNTLADIAAYFYQTDLRTPTLGNCTGSITGQNVCDDTKPDGTYVGPPSDGKKDTAPYQHMTTFTIGLGVNGVLKYDKNYETAVSGDFYDIKQGNKVWPNPVTNTSASLYDDNTVIARTDDLWHAAVNGRGHYYSAQNSTELATSLESALNAIDAKLGSGAAAATSSLTPTAGDDWLFIPLFTTVQWTGEVSAYKIDTATGARLTDGVGKLLPPVWNANDRITAQGARTVYTYKAGAPGNLAAFTYDNLSPANQANFNNLCAVGAEKLSQCLSITPAAKAKVTGANVVDYLAGTKTYELSAAAVDDQVFRTRILALGDIINTTPVYVQKPPFRYTDAGYSSFVSAQAARTGVLYVAANDGMLHAIKVSTDSTGGTELWAYVPSMVLPKMYKLADDNYANLHQYTVDGPTIVGDVYDGTNWRTVLVGGLGAGGRGYYALDVTDPTSPQVLWEISSADDPDIGLTFGNPILTKNKAGTWVVAFTSGYNNGSAASPAGSGNGYLYVRNALTGAAMSKIPTNVSGSPVGSGAAPSNLGKINAWSDDLTDNTAKRFYGGDMLGNVWRFDFDDNIAPAGNEAFRLAQTASGQPITTKPQLSEITKGGVKIPVVTIGTGRYLGASDLGDSSVQALYSFRDNLSATGLGDLSANASMVQQVFNPDRTLNAEKTVDWATSSGWFIKFNQSSGERVNVDFDQQFDRLVVATNIPTPTICSPGGTSWLYSFNLGSGSVIETVLLGTMTAGITTIVTTTGKLTTLVQGVDGTNRPEDSGSFGGAGPAVLKRTSWRELAN